MTEKDTADGTGDVPQTATTRRTFLRAAGAGAAAAGLGLGTSGSVAGAEGSFVGTDGTDFVVDGEPIAFNGSNNFWLMDTYYGTPSLHDSVFALYDRLGLNFVRTWGFRDGTKDYGEMLQTAPGEYNEAGFKWFDSLVAKAGEYGIKLVLPLVNNWDEYGGKKQYVSWVDSASNPDDFYTNDRCREIFKNYVEQVLERKNTITGVKYKNDPAIAIWELGNEPRAKGAGVDALTDWIEEMSAHIKSIDSNHLVSTGMEGFYDGAHGGSGWQYDGSQGTAYIDQHAIDTIDACSFHMYPHAWGKTPAWGNTWIEQHLADAEEQVGKPAYAGEFGLSTETFSISERNQHYRNWYDTLDQHDAAGSLIWQIGVGTRESRADSRKTGHGIYEDDTETLSIVRDYGKRARERSAVSLEPSAPHAPTGVGLTGRTSSSLTVTWNPAKGWGVGAGEYAVLLDGQRTTTVPADETGVTLSNLGPATSHAVAVQAVDATGATSDPSATVSVSTLPTSTSTFTDPCADTSELAPAADTASLGVDTTNGEYIHHPDGSADEGRLKRTTTDDVALVYAVDGQLLDMTVRFHQNTSKGGTVEYYESTDGGSSWSRVEAVRSVYDGPGAGGWSNQTHYCPAFASGASHVKLVLTGGSAAWSGQVGQVDLTYSEGGEPTPRPGVEPVMNDRMPQDMDDDDHYEDVNGDGELNFNDLVGYYQHKDDPAMQNHTAAYDYNDDGSLDFNDLVALYQEMQGI